MKKLMVLLIFFTSLTSAQAAQGLEDFFSAALNYRSSIKSKSFAIEIAEEQKKQAYSQVLPNLSVISTDVWRDPANVGPFGEEQQHTAFLSLTQNLFQGGSEYAALAIGKNLPQIAKLSFKQEKIQTYIEVATKFYSLLRYRKEANTLNEQTGTLKKRIRTLRRRTQIGRSRRTELLAAQSQQARLDAELSQIESLVIIAEQDLKNLTGLDPVKNLSDPLVLDRLKVLPTWRQLLDSNPSVRIGELQLENAQKNIKVARGAFLPSLDLDGRYYINRAGVLEDSRWDITLNARWNLFAGRTDTAEKRIQLLQSQGQEAELMELKINQKNTFEALKKEFSLQKKSVDKLKAAVRLARENYKLHIKDADSGLVDQLDVLRALDDYLQIQRSYDQQIYSAKLAWINLKALTGKIQ